MKTKDCNKKIKYMFPEYRDLIVQLREENPYFAKLFEEHNELDKEISQLELDPVNHINNDIEAIKRKKLKLKDEIYKILTRTAQVEWSAEQSVDFYRANLKLKSTDLRVLEK